MNNDQIRRIVAAHRAGEDAFALLIQIFEEQLAEELLAEHEPERIIVEPAESPAGPTEGSAP